MHRVSRTFATLIGIVTVSVLIEETAGGGGVAAAAVLGALAGQSGWARILDRSDDPV